MNIKKFSPWNWFNHENTNLRGPSSNHSPFVQLHKEIDKLFNNALSTVEGFDNGVRFRPDLDIIQRNKEYLINIELPGIEEKDINVSIANHVLSVTAEKKFEEEKKEGDQYFIECSYGSFCRELSLPDDADDSEVNAKLKKGILRIRVARKASTESTNKAKQIPIEK